MNYLKPIFYITLFTNIIIIDSSPINIVPNTAKELLDAIKNATDYETDTINKNKPAFWEYLLTPPSILNSYDVKIVPINESENVTNNWTKSQNWSSDISKMFSNIIDEKAVEFQTFTTKFNPNKETFCGIIGCARNDNNTVIMAYTSSCAKSILFIPIEVFYPESPNWGPFLLRTLPKSNQKYINGQLKTLYFRDKKFIITDIRYMENNTYSHPYCSVTLPKKLPPLPAYISFGSQIMLYGEYVCGKKARITDIYRFICDNYFTEIPKNCARNLTNEEFQNVTLTLASSIRPELHGTANSIAKMLSLPLPYPN